MSDETFLPAEEHEVPVTELSCEELENIAGGVGGFIDPNGKP